MTKDQIVVSGTYQAKVNNKLTTVRVDSIDDTSSGISYHVTNLTTNRKTIFKSAAKFRSVEGEQRQNPTPTVTAIATEKEPVSIADPSTSSESSTENAKPADVVVDTSFSKSNVLKQWEQAKAKHPEMIVLFRMGDFYEAFNEDARTLAKVLGLTITTRDRTLDMAGFPHHALEIYLHKLLKEGHRVAICEQVEEKPAIVSKSNVSDKWQNGSEAVKEGEQSRPFIDPSVESQSPSSVTSSPTSSRSGLASRLLPKEDKAPHVIVEALAGCLAADTIINMKRAGRGSQIPIEKLVKQFSGEQPTYVRSDTGTIQGMRPWDLSIPTMLARAEGSVIKLGQLESAWCSGMKETFSLTTETGRTIRATETHPFLTENGEWKLLKDLRVGGVLQVNAGRSKKGNGPKMQYRYTLTKFHPNQVVKSVGSAADGGNYCGVLFHRLVVEAEMNGMTTKELIWVLRHDADKSSKLLFLKDDQIVHHKNEDTFDNSLRNLEVLSSKEHSSKHNWGNNVLWQVGFEEIAFIEPYGVELTYDLGMADDPHNFLANGFVVHNSGKTTTLIEGLRFVMGGESKLTPSVQQRQVWDSMALSKGIAKTVAMCAFNKAIAMELQSRVPQGVEALTMHSMGFRAIRKSFPRVDAGDRGKWRVNNFLCDILQVDSREVRKDPKLSALVRTTETLVALAKMNLSCYGLPKTNEEGISTRASLNDLIEYYDIDVNGSKDKILDLIPQVIERCKDVGRDNLIDFNDMVWLPVALDLPIQQYDLLLIDEAQDLSKVQQELAIRSGKRLIFVGDKRQCQPAGTTVRVTGGGSVPIESLKVGDRLVTFNTNDSVFTGKRFGGKKVQEISKRNYSGDLYHVNQSSSTPNHRWLTRFRLDVPKDYTALYLTELKDQTYRIGMTQLVMGTGSFGPSMRARQRGATKLWVLKVFDSKKLAREMEFKDSMSYRIPQMACYEIKDEKWCLDLINDGMIPDVEGILAKYRKFYEYPIWEKGVGHHIGKYSYVTQACNLIPNVNLMCVWRDRYPSWEPLDLRIQPDWEGEVYSLKVQPADRGRRLYISDGVVTHNSIYAFAGSDSKSVDNLHKRLGESQRGLQVIPLTVTRRCGKAIVKEAQAYVPAFESHEGNPEGVITEALYTLQKGIDGLEEIPWEKSYGPLVKPGDMVLCRHNAPLVSQCFKFLKRGIKANIQGRDVGQGLSSLIRKLAGKEYDGGDKPMPIAEFVGRLDDWLHAEIEKEQAKKHPNENRIVGLQDKVDCILAFSDGVANTVQILTKIDSVFTDDRKSPGVRFSSGHKAKGLEARRVFILDPVALRFQRKKQADWEREQNNNLRYVMITRAIEELCYVV